MNKDIIKIKLENFLSTVFPEYKISLKLIKKGHNQNVYRLGLKNNKISNFYIAKIGNGSLDSEKTMINHVRILKFLESIKYENVPKIIYFNRDKKIIVEDLVGESDLCIKDFDSYLIREFAYKLVNLHKIPPIDFKVFSNKNKLGKVFVEKQIDTHKIYCLDRFELVQKCCPDKDLIIWLNKEIKKIKVDNNKNNPHLMWGDIGGNFRISERNLYMIDFEYSCLGYSTELAYIKIHTHFSEEQFTKLVMYYCRFIGVSHEEVAKDLEAEEKIIRLNDIIWSAMKWGQADKVSDIKKYKELTGIRKRLYETIQ